MQLASGCMWIWFADSIPALVGFLRALRFPPTPKNRNPFIFLVNSFWSLVVCIKPACLPEVWLPICVRCGCHTAAPWEPSGLICRALQKLQIIIFYLHDDVGPVQKFARRVMIDFVNHGTAILYTTPVESVESPGGGGTDLERGYGDVPRSWPPFSRPVGAP